MDWILIARALHKPQSDMKIKVLTGRLVLNILTLMMSVPIIVAASGCPTIMVSPATLPIVNLGEVVPPWRPTGSMTTPRIYHTATMLADGKVFVTGGYAQVQPIPVVDRYLSSAEIYDPATHTWTPTAPMSVKRAHHTATLLLNEKVLVAGGFNLDADNEHDQYLPSAELYDPATGIWTPIDPLPEGCSYAAATLLLDGRVMVAGGEVFNNGYFPISDIQIYDPSSGKWTRWSSLTIPQQDIGAVLMPNGKVLFAGGRWSPAFANLYDPVAMGPMKVASPGALFKILTLLPNGKVLGTGGGSEVYDPAADTWTETGPINGGGDGQATLLPSGRVLVSGSAAFQQRNMAELYDPATDTWKPTGSLSTGRSFHKQVLLKDGTVLACGGNSMAATEIYQPADISATGGVEPYTFAITAGSAPVGVTLHSDGIWSGVPFLMGTNTFKVTATDANGCTGSTSYTVVVGPSRASAKPGAIGISIVAPGDQKVFTSPAVTVSGVAHSVDHGVIGDPVLVLYSLNGGEQQIATTALGQNFRTWSAPVTLQPGWNTFFAQSFDNSGNGSKIASRMYFYGNPKNAAGTYNGLFYETNGIGGSLIKEQSAGAVFNLAVQFNGTYSGLMYLAGKKYGLHGNFDSLGNSSINIARGPLANVSLNMQLDWTGTSKQITGNVLCAGEGWSAPFQADLAVYSATHPHAAVRYTMAIPPAADAPANSPGGYGYGLISINSVGKVTLSGALADSSAITETVPVSKDGHWPLYVDLYNHHGLLEGWVDFANGAPTGQVTWIKPSLPTGVNLTTYLNGFVNNVEVFGSSYSPVLPAITAAGNTLEITDGSGLNLPLTFDAQVTANNQLQKLSNTPANALKGSVTTATGLFTVKFQPTGSAALKSAVGVVLQSSNAAYGAFVGIKDSTGTTTTGAIYLH